MEPITKSQNNESAGFLKPVLNAVTVAASLTLAVSAVALAIILLTPTFPVLAAAAALIPFCVHQLSAAAGISAGIILITQLVKYCLPKTPETKKPELDNATKEAVTKSAQSSEKTTAGDPTSTDSVSAVSAATPAAPASRLATHSAPSSTPPSASSLSSNQHDALRDMQNLYAKVQEASVSTLSQMQAFTESNKATLEETKKLFDEISHRVNQSRGYFERTEAELEKTRSRVVLVADSAEANINRMKKEVDERYQQTTDLHVKIEKDKKTIESKVDQFANLFQQLEALLAEKGIKAPAKPAAASAMKLSATPKPAAPRSDVGDVSQYFEAPVVLKPSAPAGKAAAVPVSAPTTASVTASASPTSVPPASVSAAATAAAPVSTAAAAAASASVPVTAKPVPSAVSKPAAKLPEPKLQEPKLKPAAKQG